VDIQGREKIMLAAGLSLEDIKEAERNSEEIIKGF